MTPAETSMIPSSVLSGYARENIYEIIAYNLADGEVARKKQREETEHTTLSVWWRYLLVQPTVQEH